MTAGTEKEGAREELSTMTFAEHLEELRKRVIVCIAAVVATMFIFFFMKDRVYAVILEPYRTTWAKRIVDWKAEVFDAVSDAEAATLPENIRKERAWISANWDRIAGGEEFSGVDVTRMLKRHRCPLNRNLISTKPLQEFLTFMLAAALFGLAIAFPIVLWQMWAFIGAGLYVRERKAVMRYLPGSLFLFVLGSLFGYYVMVPYALFFLTGLASPGVEFLLTVGDYFQFLFALTIALGFVFQLPVVMLALVEVGICTPELYTKYWRHAILSIFVMGMLFTPPDPFTQILMAGPMILLFCLGIGLSKFASRRRRRALEAEQHSPER